jgi:hypothetical protein
VPGAAAPPGPELTAGRTPAGPPGAPPHAAEGAQPTAPDVHAHWAAALEEMHTLEQRAEHEPVDETELHRITDHLKRDDGLKRAEFHAEGEFWIIELEINPGRRVRARKGFRYRGGAHSRLSAPQGIERHHMPADSASPLSTGKGPAIQMDIADHQETASWGSSEEAIGYREKQEELIDQDMFMRAMLKDVRDVQAKFGAKYNGAIAEAQTYARGLPHK